jgi:DNA repair photolyase
MKKKLDPILYEPRGRAAEYVDNGLALNLFLGCNHGCQYCYVPGQRRMSREKFHATVGVKQNAMERLERDLKKVGKQEKPIFMSFMCDPYPANPNLWHVTREAIRMILRSGNAVNILTKGGIRATRDFHMLLGDARTRVGATLTFMSKERSEQMEPMAAVPNSRLEMLSVAKDMGIRTWASIEPVIDPEESLAIMKAALPYVDEFKIGKLNHDKEREAEINWMDFMTKATTMVMSAGKTFVVKDDLMTAALAIAGPCGDCGSSHQHRDPQEIHGGQK